MWTRLGHKTVVRALSPKAVPLAQLYGSQAEHTREWQDGLLSCTMRELALMEDANPKWIVLDGDIDTHWVESLNRCPAWTMIHAHSKQIRRLHQPYAPHNSVLTKSPVQSLP